MPSAEAPAAAAMDGEQRLHPWSWLFVLLQQLRQFVLPLVALLVFGGGGGREAQWQALAAAIAMVVLVAVSLLQFFTYRYRVGADGVTIRSGWLQRNLREIPFNRIHNVTLHQSLLHRVFGVAEVRLESAGGNKPEAQMRVLGLAAAQALEDVIRHGGSDRAGRTPDAAEPADVPLLALDTADVLRLGFISNRGMIVVAVAFSALWQIFPERVASRWVEQHAQQLLGYATSMHLGVLSTVAAVGSLITFGLLLTRVLSMLLALTQFHGFRLHEQPQRLTVERGLLARLRTSVSRRRIQSWTLQEGWLQRCLRRRNLRIDTAVAETGNRSDARALKELAPIATPDACDALIQHLLPHAQWPMPAWSPLSASMRWRLLLPTVLVLLVLSVPAWLQAGPWGLCIWLWLPWAIYGAWQQTRRAGYAVDTALVAVRGGWWARYWRFAEIDKLQALRLSHSPLDRRCGTASLWLDTAGASNMQPPLRIRFMPEVQAQALYRQLSAALAARRLRW
ncbi:PH domain-containing protein [Pseudoxanthomonas dokdonensis]|uniref:Membrane protein n=1 Tax=Pseudoxanthomonas dokdonensis TaxID=344882 RepID=A0A0R0CUP7_9GAMM|nr:PH domain-containing protein [Pseudoxanthomonas dokdonensis]KRG69364.1 membrane protein [Pseudoxanthomonas dokdonensis]